MDTKKDTAQEKSDVALREESMLEFWREHDVFKKSIETPAGEAPVGDFVFYDGPPFATGLPHYGHILASTIKDAIPRFWTMQGYRVRRKWGWDCHGLPLENLIEKKLGLATKRDIEAYGIKNFNEQARDAVLEFADDWKQIIPRMGRWADMDDDYKTMDSSYTESVWWVFKALHDKGLVYEGFKSMHLCPRCGTTLSNFEVNQGYKDIKDIAVTVKLPLVDESNTSLLVWTTTPWTLPGNMAAAVHNEHTYVKARVQIDEGEEVVVLAKERLSQLATDDYEILAEMKGSDLVGKSYVPPFDYWKDQEFENKGNAWKIYHADYVELGDEGTGAVHLAPAYGEDDMNLAKEYGIPIVHHVDAAGHFIDFVTDFAGQLVKPKDDDDAEVTHLDADIEIVKALKANGRLVRKENITHSYPHCWRCDTPLLNYATTSWFVEVTKFKDELVAANNTVHWVPEHVGKNRFGKWLEGARDWAVSRQRYWGAPLPVWRNPETKEYKVFGSLAELQEYVPKSGNSYLIMRHGQSESNLAEAISANKDNDDGLTAAGKTQTEEALQHIPDDIDIIIHSGFQRTQETAEIIAKARPQAKVLEDDRIRELDIADGFEGKSWDEYNKEFQTWEDRYVKVLNGSENRRDVQKRVGAFLFDLERAHTNKKILIVGHGGVMFGLYCAARGLDIESAKEYRDTDPNPYFVNAEVRQLDFVPMPHNDNYELDFHRPYIDEVELYDGQTKLERVPDVFDCWFESGSMPYGQHHYPFECPQFETEHFPAQFIAEGLDQTRGWFYSLIVLGTALFGKSPYENVIVNGLVLAEDGKKMSKKLQNYPDPMELADRTGVDAMRFYLLSSPIIKGEDLNFSEKEVLELQRKNIGRLHNVLAMYKEYTDETPARADSHQVLDRWIVARLNELISETTAGFKNYELDRATRPITDFIDDLSVWYLRRSRDRLKGEDETDKQATLATLRHVLKNLALVMAPSMPFYAEYLWQEVREESVAKSVHLAKWPEGGEVSEQILSDMQATREVVSKALEQRAKANIKVRQPLNSVRIKNDVSAEFSDLIVEEVNVKEVISDTGMDEDVQLDTTISPELKAEGDIRDFMRLVQECRKRSGLSPRDRITLTVQTSEGGEALVNQFADDIKKTVGADEIVFDRTDGDEVTAGEHSFTVSLRKV